MEKLFNSRLHQRNDQDFSYKNFTKRMPNNLLIEMSDNSDCNHSEASDKLIETSRTLPVYKYKYKSPQVMGSHRHRPPAADPRFRKVHKPNPLNSQSEIIFDNFIKPPEGTVVLNSSLQLIKEMPITPKEPENCIPSKIYTSPPNQPKQPPTHLVQPSKYPGQPKIHPGQPSSHSVQPPIYPGLLLNFPGQSSLTHSRKDFINSECNINLMKSNENERAHNSSQTESSIFRISHNSCQTDSTLHLEPPVNSHFEKILEAPILNDWLIEETQKLQTTLEPKSKTSDKSTNSSSPSFYSTKSRLKTGRFKNNEKNPELSYKSINNSLQTGGGDTEIFQPKGILSPIFRISGEVQSMLYSDQADVNSLLNIVLLIIAVIFASLILLGFFYLLQQVVDIIYTSLFVNQEVEEEGVLLNDSLTWLLNVLKTTFKSMFKLLSKKRTCSVSIFSTGC